MSPTFADLCRLHTKRVPRMGKDTQQAVGFLAGTDVVEHDTSECFGLTVDGGIYWKTPIIKLSRIKDTL